MTAPRSSFIVLAGITDFATLAEATRRRDAAKIRELLNQHMGRSVRDSRDQVVVNSSGDRSEFDSARGKETR